MDKIEGEEIKSEDCSRLILQAYSMKPMEEIETLIASIDKESELSSDDQNLLYFYRLINDFFNVHKQHQNCTKQ